MPQVFFVIAAATFAGTSWYFANSIVYVARPWLIERMDVEYRNISASGTSAVTTLPDDRILHADDLAATAIQVADDVAVVILRRHDLDLHDRLEEDRLRLATWRP